MLFAREWFVAHRAHMRIVTGVMFQVVGEMLTPCEDFITKFTFMRRNAGVYHLVVVQMLTPINQSIL